MKRWKKKWREAVSLTLVLMLIMSSIPFYSSHAADVDADIVITDFRMTLDGKELPTDPNEPNLPTYKKGQKFIIDLEWELPNFVVGEEDYVCELDLTDQLKNLKLSYLGELDLKQGDQVIGTFHIDENNKITITINKEAMNSMSDRTGWATIEGVLSDDVKDDQDSEKVDVGFGDKIFWIEYDAGVDESTLNVDKYRWNNQSVRRENGTYLQTFGVTLTAKKGQVTLKDLVDNLGGKLSNISNLQIMESDIEGVSAGTTYTKWDDLEKALTDKTLGKDKKITFTYDVEVDSEGISDFDWQDTYKNTVTVDYDTNKGNRKEKSDSEYASVTPPKVSKSGTLSSDHKTVTWTITLELNSIWESGKTLEELGVEKLKDTLGTGFGTVTGVDLDNIDLSKMQHQGNGRYTFTFTAPVQEEYQNRPGKTTLKNDVTVTIDGEDFDGHGEVTIEGDKWLNKEAIGYDAETGLLSWRVDLTNIPDGIKNVSLTDNPGWNHNTISNVRIEIDGQTIYDLEKGVANGKISYNSGKITFTDDYIKSNKGKNITVYIDTVVADESVLGNWYQNNVTLNYEDTVGEDTLTDSATWTSSQNSKITKRGWQESQDPKNVLTYDITVDLKDLSLKAGEKIKLTDHMPEGAELIRDSLTVSYQKNWETPIALTDFSLDTKEKGEFEIEIPITQQMVDDKTNGADRQQMVVTYKVKRAEMSSAWKQGNSERLVNTASGKYQKEDLGEDYAEQWVTPPQLVSKYVDISDTDSIYANTKPGYTVNVNPGAMDLVENNDRITAVDQLGSALEYDLDSIQVRRQTGTNTWETMVNGSGGYTYHYDKTNNTLTFDLPDETAIQITYNVIIKEGVTELDQDNASNSISLSGYSGSQSGDSATINGTVTNVGAGAGGVNGNITINKFWLQNGVKTSLSGSTFEIYRMNSDMTGVIQSSKKICTADLDADEGQQYVVSGLQYDNVYVLRETGADQGFKINEEDYYFYIHSKGVTLPAGDKYEVVEGNEPPSDGKIAIHSLEDSGTLEYENEPVLLLTKTIKGSVTKEEVEDTLRFHVTNGTTYDEIFNLKDDFVLQTSANGDRIYVLKQPLPSGKYTVEESVSTISGYTEKVTYTIGNGGETKGKKAQITISQNEITEVAFEDDYTKIQNPGKLIVTKTIQGPVTREEAEGALRFRITNEEIDFDNTYTLEDFLYNDETGLYTLELEVAAGTYLVQETITDIDGKETQSVTYAINGANVNGSSAAAQVAQGGEVTVAITDIYTQAHGTLILTKQIEGDVTREEAEGAIRFTVTDTGTNGPGTTYFLKDFEYDGATGIYTLTLTEPVGTYQIEETVTDINGYVLKSVVYSVDGGTAAEGKGTQVTIDQNGTTRIDFKDVYEKQVDDTPTPTVDVGQTPTPSADVTQPPVPTVTQTPAPTETVDDEDDDEDDEDDDDDTTTGGKKRTNHRGNTPKTADERNSLIIEEFVMILISGCGIILLALRERKYAYIGQHTKRGVNRRKKDNRKTE